jgi:hypothetical protein
LIKESMEVKVVHIKRDQNVVTHALAAFGCTSMCSVVRLRPGPIGEIVIP